MKILEMFKSVKSQFPKTAKIAPAYEIYHRDKTYWDKDFEMLMEYFGKDGKYVDYREGEVIDFIKKGEWIGVYEIESITRRGNGMSDYACWDDRRNYVLKLKNIKKI